MERSEGQVARTIRPVLQLLDLGLEVFWGVFPFDDTQLAFVRIVFAQDSDLTV